MINPAEICFDKLPWVPFHRLQDLPPVPAIYICLAYPGLPVYIGETGNLHKRWVNHSQASFCREKDVVSIAWISEVPANGYDRRQIENALIRHYRPPLNAQLRNGRSHRKIEAVLGVNLGVSFDD